MPSSVGAFAPESASGAEGRPRRVWGPPHRSKSKARDGLSDKRRQRDSQGPRRRKVLPGVQDAPSAREVDPERR